MTKSMLVYMDSSDFSDLAARRSESRVADVYDKLIAYRDSGQVTFVFSAVHVTEVAPTNPDAAPYSSGRSDMISEICGRNALISMDRLVDEEIVRLASRADNPVEACSNEGQWYPEVKDIISPVLLAETVAEELEVAISKEQLNRSDRRALKKRLIRKGSPTKELRMLLASNSKAANLESMLESYPMRPADAKVLNEFIVGRATRIQAEKAFLNSLKDVSFMMRWFEQHYQTMSPITEWLRGPAQKFIASMVEVSDSIRELKALQNEAGIQIPDSPLTQEGWKKMQDQHLARFVEARLRRDGNSVDSSTVREVDRYCPGIAMFVRTLHSAMWTLTQDKPRNPKVSDFADAVHAIYLPYVDVFRADKFMSTFLRDRARKYNAEVVSKLVDLPKVIDAKLAANH